MPTLQTKALLFLALLLGLAVPAQADLVNADVAGDAEGSLLAVSVFGDSRGAVAVSATGNSTARGVCWFHSWCMGAAVSGTGEARDERGGAVAASGCDALNPTRLCWPEGGNGTRGDGAPTRGLVARWRFDDADRSGLLEERTADSSGHGNHGLVEGPKPAPGRVGEAYRFPGHGAWITVEATPSAHVLGDLTFAAWLAPADLGEHFVVNKWSPGEERENNRAYNVLLGGGRVAYRHEHGEGQDVVVTTAGSYFLPGEWTHLAVVRDAAARTLTFYVNGAAVETHPYAANPDGGEDTKLWLGHEPWQSHHDFRGVMDEVHLFAAALTASEVEALYRAS